MVIKKNTEIAADFNLCQDYEIRLRHKKLFTSNHHREI